MVHKSIRFCTADAYFLMHSLQRRRTWARLVAFLRIPRHWGKEGGGRFWNDASVRYILVKHSQPGPLDWLISSVCGSRVSVE